MYLESALCGAVGLLGSRFGRFIHGLGRDRRAVAALEYAILAAALGLVLLAVFSNFQEKLSVLLAPMNDAVPPPPPVP